MTNLANRASRIQSMKQSRNATFNGVSLNNKKREYENELEDLIRKRLYPNMKNKYNNLINSNIDQFIFKKSIMPNAYDILLQSDKTSGIIGHIPIDENSSKKFNYYKTDNAHQFSNTQKELIKTLFESGEQLLTPSELLNKTARIITNVTIHNYLGGKRRKITKKHKKTHKRRKL